MTDGYYGAIDTRKLYATGKTTPLCSANSRTRRKYIVIQPMGLLDKHASRLPLFKHLKYIGAEIANTGSASVSCYNVHKK